MGRGVTTCRAPRRGPCPWRPGPAQPVGTRHRRTCSTSPTSETTRRSTSSSTGLANPFEGSLCLTVPAYGLGRGGEGVRAHGFSVGVEAEVAQRREPGKRAFLLPTLRWLSLDEARLPC